jgi:hypothetical protein
MTDLLTAAANLALLAILWAAVTFCTVGIWAIGMLYMLGMLP